MSVVEASARFAATPKNKKPADAAAVDFTSSRVPRKRGSYRHHGRSRSPGIAAAAMAARNRTRFSESRSSPNCYRACTAIRLLMLVD